MDDVTRKIDKLYDAVAASKFGPIFFNIVDDKIVPVDRVYQTGDNASLPIRTNSIAMDVFKCALYSCLGVSIKNEDSGDAWRNS